MTRTRTVVVALSLCATFGCSQEGLTPENPAAPSAIGATNAKPTGEVPVTSKLGVLGAFDIGSDGVNGGDYENSSSLRSAIGPNGVWQLGLTDRNNTTRTVHLNFGNPAAGSDPRPDLTSYYKAFLYIACNHDNYSQSENYSGNLLMLPSGQTMVCPMTVTFSADGRDYVLRMGAGGVSDPNNDHVNIYCAEAATPGGPAQCKKWQIRPSGAGASNIARLSYSAGKGNNTSSVTVGDYNMSFSIDLTNP